jgi:hypothetical protein
MSLNLPLVVRLRFATAIHYNERCNTIEASVAGAKHNIICPIYPAQFPRSFEQLEEFPHDSVTRGICDNAYHDEIS